MREFKFRAWHKGYDYPATRMPIPAAMLYEDRIGQCLTWKQQGQPLEVMQFTGITDKNGKEIYEGDVVRDGAGQINPITFSAGTYWFNWLHLVDVIEPLEVLGNIYENPELSQGEHE